MYYTEDDYEYYDQLPIVVSWYIQIASHLFVFQ
jgi:hypothetical protein